MKQSWSRAAKKRSTRLIGNGRRYTAAEEVLMVTLMRIWCGLVIDNTLATVFLSNRTRKSGNSQTLTIRCYIRPHINVRCKAVDQQYRTLYPSDWRYNCLPRFYSTATRGVFHHLANAQSALWASSIRRKGQRYREVPTGKTVTGRLFTRYKHTKYMPLVHL